jgi:hypothetical protein
MTGCIKNKYDLILQIIVELKTKKKRKNGKKKKERKAEENNV